MSRIMILFALIGCNETGIGYNEPPPVVPNAPEPINPVQLDRIVKVAQPQVDILFVIDNSCSMVAEQDALTRNFRSFIQIADSGLLNYQIGVTSTDVSVGDTSARGRLEPVDADPVDRIVTRASQPTPLQRFVTNGRAVGTEVADDLRGPWRDIDGNPLIERKWDDYYDVSHISSPHAIWREDLGEIWLYYHGENTTTRWARSQDGVHFTYGGEAIQTPEMADMSGAS